MIIVAMKLFYFLHGMTKKKKLWMSEASGPIYQSPTIPQAKQVSNIAYYHDLCNLIGSQSIHRSTIYFQNFVILIQGSLK